MLTGVHLFHVALGLLDPGRRGPRTAQPAHAAGCRMVESGATYWHMVDLLWIVIFATALRDEVSR